MTQHKSPPYRSTVALGATFPVTRRRWTCTYAHIRTLHVHLPDTWHTIITIWQHANSRLHQQMANRVKKPRNLSRRTSSRVFAPRKLHILQREEVQGMQSLATSPIEVANESLMDQKPAVWSSFFPPGSVYIGFRANFLSKRPGKSPFK